MDQMVTAWELQVEENKKLLPSQRAPVPAKSYYLVQKRWEAAALGALQEASEAYLIGIFEIMCEMSVSSNSKFSVNAN